MGQTLMKALAIIAISLFISCAAPADSLSQVEIAHENAKQLQALTEAANQICQRAPLNSQSIKIELSAEASATVSQLLRKLAGGKIEGRAQWTDAHTEGVLQSDLAAAIANGNSCAKDAIALLKDDLLVPLNPQVSEVSIVQHVVDDLCGRGVLSNPVQWEIPGAVYESVRQIRNNLTDTLHELPANSLARPPLQAMQDAARLVIQDPTVFPNGPGGMARPVRENTPLWSAITQFRSTFADNVGQLKSSYKIGANCHAFEKV